MKTRTACADHLDQQRRGRGHLPQQLPRAAGVRAADRDEHAEGHAPGAGRGLTQPGPITGFTAGPSSVRMGA
jgi:hypothetical protein